MRVTNSMMYGGIMTDMHNNLSKLMKLNKQLSTGKLNHRPSDSPIDVTRELSLGTTIYENEQYIRNMDDGLTWLKNTDTAMNQIGDMIARVRELAVKSGNGSYDDEEAEAVAQELIQIQEGIRQAANYSVEGRYLLSGASTAIPPFQRDANGDVAYMGNEFRVQYEMERGIVSDVSFNGRQVFPQDHTQYTLESVDLPRDFEWSGRNEIIQFTVGDRAVKVRIPEDGWADNDNGYVANSPDTDYNRYRDPEEMKPMSLDDIAKTIENSMNMGDSGRLVSVRVVQGSDSQTQRLQIRSHTGERIALTSWPETDVIQMPRAIGSTNVDDTGGAYTLPNGGDMTISLGTGESTTISFGTGMSLEDMAKAISEVEGVYGKVVNGGTANASLAIVAKQPGTQLEVDFTDGLETMFGSSTVVAEEVTLPPDHSHTGLSSLLGMETTLKSTEFPPDYGITGLSDTNKVHWYLEGGDHKAEVMVNAGPDMSLDDLAKEIRAVAGDWLDVIVQTDPGDKVAGPDTSGSNEEKGTQKLILRTKDGQPVNVIDIAPDSDLANPNTNLAQSMGLSTAVYAESGATFPTGTDLDARMPARMKVSVGDRDYTVKLYAEDVVDTVTGKVDSAKMAKEIQKQVGKGSDGQYLIKTVDLTGPAGNPEVAMFSTSGEPMRFADLPFGDPALKGYSAGLALQSGISTGVAGNAVDQNLAVDAGSGGVIRFESLGRSVNISVSPGDTSKDLAEKIEKYAGDWLDVAYMDPDLDDPSNTDVRLSIAAKDGSAVNIVDLEPATMSDGSTGAAEAFGIDTAAKINDLGALDPLDISVNHTLTIKVDGYEHTIDLRQLDIDNTDALELSELEKLPDLINARFQGQDVKAELYTDSSGDKHIIMSSPRGLNFEVSSATALTGGGTLSSPDRSPNTPWGQNVTRRTGADQRATDFFGFMDDLIDAVRSQDVQGVSSMLSDIDDQITTVLKARTEVGALINRYEGSQSRLTENNLNYSDLKSTIGDTDLAKGSMEYLMAQAIYQAGLATVAKIIQPTLVDFLR
nr:flagellar hook-associated protein FlgL [uncultured Dethiosulfovibrio sp.]